MSSALGTLFLVATPIGNLEDISYRAVRILREADELYCEDTRRTLNLLRHFGIERSGALRSFHDHSPRSALAFVRKALEEGKSVAYATDGGMPVVSDPGYTLVREALACGAGVSVVPGPSAAVALFAASGLAAPKFLFHGFFPRTRGEVARVLETIGALAVAHVFYESPARVLRTLGIVARHFPRARVVFGRELTKLHEEVLRGEADEVFKLAGAKQKIRGECVLAVLLEEAGAKGAASFRVAADGAGADASAGAGADDALTDAQKAEITAFIKAGNTSKDTARALSKQYGIPRRTIYEFIVKRLT